MQNNIDPADFEALQQRLSLLEQAFASHNHDGFATPRLNLFSIFGKIQTSITSTETTARTGAKPNDIYDQMFIDTSTATKKLYIYDAIGNAWRSCTIA